LSLFLEKTERLRRWRQSGINFSPRKTKIKKSRDSLIKGERMPERKGALLQTASEVGIDAADFGDDVAAFLEGGVSLARDSALLLALR